MWEWISQLDSAPQIGPETTLKVFLMVVGTWSAVGENLFFHRAEIFALECFCLFLNNQRSYDQTETTGVFSASNRSRNILGSLSDSRLVMLY